MSHNLDEKKAGPLPRRARYEETTNVNADIGDADIPKRIRGRKSVDD